MNRSITHIFHTIQHVQSNPRMRSRQSNQLSPTGLIISTVMLHYLNPFIQSHMILILVQVNLKRTLHQLNQHSQTDPIISTVIFQYQNPCIQKRMILILARKNQCHIKLQLPPQNQNSKDNTILKLGKKNQYHPSQHFPNIKIVLISIKKWTSSSRQNWMVYQSSPKRTYLMNTVHR